MTYGVLFLLLATGLTLQAVVHGGWYWLLLWPAASFAIVSAGYLGLGAAVFGKRRDGTLRWYAAAVLLPYLLLAWAAWRFLWLASREDCWNEVAPGVLVGRRPLASEVPAQVSLVVDLTAEFFAARGLRAGREYIAVPILDTLAAAEEPFSELVRAVAAWPGTVYIHCAQGHGRTGMLAAVVLVAKGHSATIDEAIARLQAARPRLALKRRQLAFARSVCARMSAAESTSRERTPSLRT